MCDLDCTNLIDLSLEGDSIIQHLPTEAIKTENYPPHPSSSAPIQSIQFVSPSSRKRDSLDNNPFDCVQKLANNRQDDPFDIMEKEACFKARHSMVPPVEVRLGNLLSLSDENIDQNKEKGGKKSLNDITLENESPPVTMIEKAFASDSCSETDSNPNSSADSAASSKVKKAMEYRRRLLKLSVTNSAMNSPASRRSSIEESDIPGTPVSALLSRISQHGEAMLSSESPLKFVDDDIMSEEPPSLLLEAEKNFEADLEMLKIPMLTKIPSPVKENPLLDIENKLFDGLNHNRTNSTLLEDLEFIKAKLKAKRDESNNNHQHDISSLICDLRALINSGSSVDNETKIQASKILETLSTALCSSREKDSCLPSEEKDNLTVPDPIKRQGTFDVELQEDENLNNQKSVYEMPNCMISSTATYDGETPEERLVDLQLPEIDPPSPSDSPSTQNVLQSDVTDIVEQLSKLLIHNNSGDGAQNSQSNPTFIVVMNTTPMAQNNAFSVAKERSAMVKSFIDDSFHDGSPDISTSNNNNVNTSRRRSQSLSIHDKVKIVQLPIRPPTPKRLQTQNTADIVDTPPTTSTMSPPDDVDTPEFKTPARMIRRNSYSSGTPCATGVGLRKAGFSSDGKPVPYIRRTSTLGTHHEGQVQQQKAIVRPMTLPTNNMSSFKPDLKKKNKSNTESIMKSSGPLKATIPVKKVAPMIKTSPPSPGPDALTNDGHKTSHNKGNKIPTTPMSTSRSSKLSVGTGYPNACSTPSAFTSPMKRTSGAITKPRYSYMSVTPNPKSTSTSSVSSTSLKRRTMTEFKARSPLKPRVSSSGLATAAASVASNSLRISASSSSSSRLSTSAGAKLSSKPPAKINPNTATVRPTGRFGPSRPSSVGSNLVNRNKENKHP